MISKTLAEMAAHQGFILWMTCSGLVIFFVFFISMLFWTSLRANQALYHSLSQLPLEKDHKKITSIKKGLNHE